MQRHACKMRIQENLVYHKTSKTKRRPCQSNACINRYFIYITKRDALSEVSSEQEAALPGELADRSRLLLPPLVRRIVLAQMHSQTSIWAEADISQ